VESGDGLRTAAWHHQNLAVSLSAVAESFTPAAPTRVGGFKQCSLSEHLVWVSMHKASFAFLQDTHQARLDKKSPHGWGRPRRTVKQDLVFDVHAQLHHQGNFTQQGIVDGEEIWCIHEGRSGNIWFSAKQSPLYRYDGNGFTKLKEQDEVTSLAFTILEDSSGRLWLSGTNGLFRHDGESFVRVTKDGPWR
jgi:hypothetical protein